jgi:hypothetical protein
VLIKPFVPDGTIITLDIGILPGLSRLDMPDRNSQRFSPFQQLAADLVRAVVDTNGARSAAPFDDRGKAADDPLRRQRKVDLDAQTFAVEVIQHVQQPERPAVAKAIGHEVHRPDRVRGVRDRQRIRLVPFQPLEGLDPQVQLELAGDPVNPFVVPDAPLNVAKLQKT